MIICFVTPQCTFKHIFELNVALYFFKNYPLNFINLFCWTFSLGYSLQTANQLGCKKFLHATKGYCQKITCTLIVQLGAYKKNCPLLICIRCLYFVSYICIGKLKGPPGIVSDLEIKQNHLHHQQKPPPKPKMLPLMF